MKRVLYRLVLLATLAPWSLQAAFTPVKTAGFENGNGGEVVSLGTGATVQSTTVLSGGFTLKQAGVSSTIISGVSYAQLGVRFSFRKPGSGAERTGLVVFSIPVELVRLDLTDSDKLRLFYYGLDEGVTTTGSTTLQPDTKYTIRVTIDTASNGALKVWLDNNLEINVTHDGGNGNLTGVTVTGRATTNEYFFDDFLFGSTTDQPPLGLNISRSPSTGGTPTYDDWAKSTGTDCGALWNDTPFSAADYCVEADTTGAQTAQVGDFNATQTGHGTETIGDSDTINACKVGMVAKRGGGGSTTHSIRRRVNSADTDTAQTLTTGDAYYEESTLWTDTLTNLNGAQIGGVISGGQDYTIEDNWLVCDYTVFAAPPSSDAPVQIIISMRGVAR